ncbi:hypothetical protein FFI16_012050 [Pseudomonas sp. KBS0710]|uniref:HNH endonuclease n=1 Tax=Pseudomonas sp. KBS0710 TaxID=1179667 RepID=UPI00110F625A|nr:hypothetical protein [Pseudomonas sp. KBS0710]TSD77118.1 hypothetical protein FFI16_012050 [Pseudomonas sp. KBS0710]
MSATLTDVEQQAQCNAYLLRAHDVDSHIKDTVTFLRTLNRYSYLKADVWKELSTHNEAKASGVTGPLIKQAFRKFVIELQGNRCCYCRRWLLNIAHAKPIEHILPKVHYPQFSLHFWNLAVACFDCNQLKQTSNWSTVALSQLDYPTAAMCTDFYHARFHRYAEHVSYERRESNHASNVTYTGHTSQGKHLCREMLYIIAARENLYSNNPTLAEAVIGIQQFQDRHQSGELPHLEAFRNGLNASLQLQLDKSGVDAAPLKN